MASIFSDKGSLVTRGFQNPVVGISQHLYSNLSKQTSNSSAFSMEGLMAGDQSFSNESIAAETMLKQSVTAALGADGFSQLTDGQKDVARVLMLTRDAKSAGIYQQRFFGNESMQKQNAVEGATIFGTPIGINGKFDYQVEPRAGWTTPSDQVLTGRGHSNEVFDGRPLDNMLATSVSFHILAARQSPAAEAAYPVYAMPPDATGFTVEVERPLVFNQLWHNATGDTVQFDKHRQLLLNARMDATILAQTATKMVPWYDEGNTENTSQFADPTVVVPRSVTIGGQTFLTSALKPGAKLNSLLGLSANPAVAQFGQENTTDTMDSRGSLEAIYVQITPATGTPSTVQFKTLNLPYAGFTPSWEGQQRRMLLNFESSDLVVSVNTLDYNTGVAATALAGLAGSSFAGLKIRLAVDVNGKANLESSEIQIQNATLSIDSIIRVTGTGPLATVEVVDDPTLIAAVKALFTSFQMVGYDPEAYRANLNRRQYGQLVTNERLRDMHIVNLGSPITAQVPIVEMAAHTVDVTAPANAVMIRNTNQAWTQLFTFEQSLNEAQSAYAGGDATAPAIRAIGRYILRRPWYGYDTFNADQEINTLKSSERNTDLGAAILNKARLMVNEGYYQTNYQAAMDSIGAKVGERPEIVAICNPVLANYLMVDGDTRSMGEDWTMRIIPEQDTRFTIPAGDTLTYPLYFFFRVKGQDGPHPCNFGNMVYKPDLISNLPITRDNATTVEFTIQPMTLHVNHCPVLFRLDIVGLAAAATERLSLPMVFA